MSASLLAGIRAAFPVEPLPAAVNRTIAALSTPSQLLPLAWPDVSDTMLEASWPEFARLPAALVSYYLPAFLGLALRATSPSSPAMERLLLLLKLPTEVIPSLVVSAAVDQPLLRPDDLTEALNAQLAQTNIALQSFWQWSRELTTLQARAVYRFLVYVRDELPEAAWSYQAKVAIYRYWFKFA